MMTAALPRWLKGDREAIALILALHRIAEVWDDLIDSHGPPPHKDINDAFHAALIEIPRNPFFQRNFARLSPLLETAILDWHTANAFEASRDLEKLRTAFILRCGLLSVTAMAACIIGGPAWGQIVNTEIRAHGDAWAEYRQKHEVA